MDNKKIFASNLNHYMKINGKSRREICEALGLSYYTFTDWVNGKKFPRMDKVEMLADYFGILKSDLIEDKSLNDRIKEAPAVMAERHIEVLMDEDIMEIFEDFKKLDAKEKAIVKKFVRSMADTEA